MSLDGTLANGWYQVFRTTIRSPDLGGQLRAAADGVRLRPWTELLTTAVAIACQRSGWTVAAKFAGQRPLPVPRDEYLGIDVLAFESVGRWTRPVAAFELENSAHPDLVHYAMWKACMVEAPLVAVFCYNGVEATGRELVSGIESAVLTSLLPRSEVMVVLGTRASAETFPDGYFRPYVWAPEERRLRPLALRPQ